MSILAIPALVRGRHIWDEYRFPPEEFETRRGCVRSAMRKDGLSGLLLYADSLSGGAVEYLTYYHCAITWSNALLLLPLEGTPHLILSVPPRDTARVQAFTPPGTQVEFAGLSLVANDHIGERAAAYLQDKVQHGERWAGVNLGAMPWKAVQAVEELLGPLPDYAGRFGQLRSVKTPAEQAVMAEVAAIAKRTALDLARFCQPGVTERGALYAADRRARYDGAEDVQLLTAGAQGVSHLHFATDARFAQGDCISIYCQVQYLRYQGVFGTTFRVGAHLAAGVQTPDGTRQKRERIALDVERDGVVPADAMARYQLRPDSFSGIHGMGMDLCEMPASEEGTWTLQEGNVLNITVDECAGQEHAFDSETYLYTSGRLIPLAGPPSQL